MTQAPFARAGLLVLIVAVTPARAADCVEKGRVTGTVPNQRFGTSLAPIGDVDGDGVPDFAVGAPGTAPGSPLSVLPSVYVFSGRTGALLAEDPGVVRDLLGVAVSRLGDVNHDGVPDFLAGAPGEPGPVQTPDPSVVVLSGVDASPVYKQPGPIQSEYGLAVAGGPDLDGDGVPDFAVGAPSADGAAPASGAVFVHSGANGALILVLRGEATGDRFGASIAIERQPGPSQSATHLLVGAPGADVILPGGGLADDAGAAYLFALFSASPPLKFPGEHAEDRFGAAVAFWKNPGPAQLPLFLVGAPNALTGSATRAGRVDVIDPVGPGGGCIHFFTGSTDGDLFGAAVAGIGDVTGDGIPDIIVGAQGGPVSPAGGAGSLSVFAGDNWLPLCSSATSPDLSVFGFAPVELADLNRDGFPEWIAGNPGISFGPVSPVGQARIFGVAPGPPLGRPAGIDIDEDAAGIVLRWAPAATACGGSDFAVYEGTYVRAGQGLTTHLPQVCSTGGASQITLPEPAVFPRRTALYFIVDDQSANGEEGSYGLSSAGRERPQSSKPCQVFLNTQPCPGNDFSIAAKPVALTLRQGNQGTSTILTAITAGAAESISLTVSGAPPGASASLNPSSVATGHPSTLFVDAGTAAPGSYTLNVTGTGSSATHSTPVQLVILVP